MKHVILSAILFLPYTAFAEGVFVDKTMEAVEGQYVVFLNEDASLNKSARDNIAALAKTGAVTIKAEWQHVGAGMVITGADRVTADEIARTDGVKTVAQDVYMYPSAIQNGAPQQLDRIDQATLPLDGKFSYTRTGTGFNTYILDGGIRTTHQDLAGRADNLINIFAGGVPYTGPGSDHGTGVASVIAGTVSGVAKTALVHSVVVSSDVGTTPIGDMVSGIDWVLAHATHPAVINISYNTPYTSTNPMSVQLKNAVAALINAGFFVSASAGNSGEDSCTDAVASVPGVFTVGGIDTNDHYYVSAFNGDASGYGPCVSGFAEMNVTMAKALSNTAFGPDGGTSFAAPIAAGLAAVYWQASPSINRLQITSQIQAHCSFPVIGAPAGTTTCLLRNWL